jgi:hypothetical protein
MCQCLEDCCGCCSVCACGPPPESSADNASSASSDVVFVGESKAAPVQGGCCSGDKGGNPSAAEVLDVDSLEDAMAAPNKPPRSNVANSVTPVMHQIEALAVHDTLNQQEVMPSKSCCSTSKKQDLPDSQISSLDGTQTFTSGAKGNNNGDSVRTTVASHGTSGSTTISRKSSVAKAGTKGNAPIHPRPIMPRPLSKISGDIATSSKQDPEEPPVPDPRPIATTSSNNDNRSTGYPVAAQAAPTTLPSQALQQQTSSIDPFFAAEAVSGMPPVPADFPFDPWTGLPNKAYKSPSLPGVPAQSFFPSGSSSSAPPNDTAMPLTPELLRAATLFMLQQQQQAQQQSQGVQMAPGTAAIPQSTLHPEVSYMPDINGDMAPMYGFSTSQNDMPANDFNVGAARLDQNPLDSQDFGQVEAMFQRFIDEAGDGQSSNSVSASGEGMRNHIPTITEPFTMPADMQEFQQL